jgi:hypothetical protein
MMSGGVVKRPRKRPAPGLTRSDPEAQFRQEVYKFLKKDRRIVDYKRVENGITGEHGRHLPDFLFWTQKHEYWLELKSPGHNLDEGQLKFKAHCVRTNKPHITAWTVEDIVQGIEAVEAVG